jgi:iron complex outermembrane receptor protein
MLSRILGWVVLCLLTGTVAFADDTTLTGTVTLPGGKLAKDAIVSIESERVSVRTDEQGKYTIVVPKGAYTIFVEAPGCETHGETVSTGDRNQLQLDFVLQFRNLRFEEIVVGAADMDSVVSVSSPTTTIEPTRQAKTSSVLAAVTDIPGVAPLGQGGLFQVPSIRGAARERTILLLESVRVTSERRTGPSFSFVDPLFMERLNVTRGPAPVMYGSNGETGLIQATVLEPDSSDLIAGFRAGYLSNSNENWQVLSLKNGMNGLRYALGVARREGGDYEAGDGQAYPSGFTRVNVFGKARWLTDAGSLTVTVMPTWTNDIDKASSDAATRPTLYPRERHQVYMVDWQNPLFEETFGYQIQTWLHPSSLVTQDDRVVEGAITSRNVVFNDTDDFGARFRVGRSLSKTWRFWTGVDLFARRNIDASQNSYAPSASGFELTDSFYSIESGSYTDTGLFLTAGGTLGKMMTDAGLRIQRVQVGNKVGKDVSSSENDWSGNLGISYPFSANWDGVLNIGRGIRPATISELFFTGETGRGSVAGNPNLVTESNLEIDGGIRYRRGKGYAGFYLFRNNIDQFIARVRVEGDSFTYVNLSKVAIYGVEGEAYYGWNSFRFYGNFHSIKGHDAHDLDVNDIPPSRLIAGIEYEPTASRWLGSVEFVGQFKKSDPGPDELPRAAALVVNAKVQCAITGNLKIRVDAMNLNNGTYYDSADNRAPLAIGRRLGLELLVDF